MPADRCTMLIESSTVTLCAPVACTSISVAEAGQHQRLAPVDDVAAVELGGHVHGECALLQATPGGRRVGRGGGEVAAHGDEDFHLPGQHGLDGADGVEPMRTRRLEAELGAEAIQAPRAAPPRCPWCGRPAHCCGRAPGRPRAGLADLAAQQQQVDDHLDGRHRSRCWVMPCPSRRWWRGSLRRAARSHRPSRAARPQRRAAHQGVASSSATRFSKPVVCSAMKSRSRRRVRSRACTGTSKTRGRPRPATA